MLISKEDVFRKSFENRPLVVVIIVIKECDVKPYIKTQLLKLHRWKNKHLTVFYMRNSNPPLSFSKRRKMSILYLSLPVPGIGCPVSR